MAALVRVDTLPFVALAGADGRYAIAAPAGNATVSARVSASALAGSLTTTVAAGATVLGDLLVAPTATTLAVTPADGTIAVPVASQIQFVASAPLAAATVTGSTVQLKCDGAVVPSRVVLSGNGLTATLVPLAQLAQGVVYTLETGALADVYGGAISLPVVHFTTAVDAPVTLDANRVVFSMPDAQGLVSVTAAPGAFPPAATVMVVNLGNGIVASFTTANDGSLSGTLRASIQDRLRVTVGVSCTIVQLARLRPRPGNRSTRRPSAVLPYARSAPRFPFQATTSLRRTE